MFEVLDAHADADRWDEYVQALPHEFRDVHVTSAWARVHSGQSAMGKMAVWHDEPNGFIVCLPFMQRPVGGPLDYCDVTCAGYGGPHTSLALPGPEHALEFDRLWSDWCREHGVVSEFYLLNPVYVGAQAILLPPDAALVPERLVVLLHCGTNAEITRGLRATRRHAIDKGGRGKTAAVSPEAMTSIYNDAMGRKGAPERWADGRDYFRLFASEIGRSGLMLGMLDGDLLAAGAAFAYGTVAAYYDRAATVENPPAGFADILVLSGLMAARDRGCHWFHLGGGRQDGDTLWSYKKSFGGIHRRVYSVRRVHNDLAYQNLSGDSIETAHGFFPAYRAKENV